MLSPVLSLCTVVVLQCLCLDQGSPTCEGFSTRLLKGPTSEFTSSLAQVGKQWASSSAPFKWAAGMHAHCLCKWSCTHARMFASHSCGTIPSFPHPCRSTKLEMLGNSGLDHMWANLLSSPYPGRFQEVNLLPGSMAFAMVVGFWRAILYLKYFSWKSYFIHIDMRSMV